MRKRWRLWGRWSDEMILMRIEKDGFIHHYAFLQLLLHRSTHKWIYFHFCLILVAIQVDVNEVSCLFQENERWDEMNLSRYDVMRCDAGEKWTYGGRNLVSISSHILQLSSLTSPNEWWTRAGLNSRLTGFPYELTVVNLRWRRE